MMKSLTESILDKPTDDADKKAPAHITYKKFITDFESILKSHGLNFTDISKKSTENPIVFKDQINSRADNTFGKYKGMVDKYVISYSWPNDYTAKYGYSYYNDSFKLTILTWYDDNLKRPRYKIDGFKLLLPETKTEGYDTAEEWKSFGSKKITPEYYELALSHIRNIVDAFMGGQFIMSEFWRKTSNRKPMKSDFNKVCKLIFNNLLKNIE